MLRFKKLNARKTQAAMSGDAGEEKLTAETKHFLDFDIMYS